MSESEAPGATCKRHLSLVCSKNETNQVRLSFVVDRTALSMERSDCPHSYTSRLNGNVAVLWRSKWARRRRPTLELSTEDNTNVFMTMNKFLVITSIDDFLPKFKQTNKSTSCFLNLDGTSERERKVSAGKAQHTGERLTRWPKTNLECQLARERTSFHLISPVGVCFCRNWRVLRLVDRRIDAGYGIRRDNALCIEQRWEHCNEDRTEVPRRREGGRGEDRRRWSSCIRRLIDRRRLMWTTRGSNVQMK